MFKVIFDCVTIWGQLGLQWDLVSKKNKLSVFLRSLRALSNQSRSPGPPPPLQVQDHSSPGVPGELLKTRKCWVCLCRHPFQSELHPSSSTRLCVYVLDAEREKHIQIWVFVYWALANQILNPPNMTEKLMKRETDLKEPIRKSPTTLLLLTEQ